MFTRILLTLSLLATTPFVQADPIVEVERQIDWVSAFKQQVLQNIKTEVIDEGIERNFFTADNTEILLVVMGSSLLEYFPRISATVFTQNEVNELLSEFSSTDQQGQITWKLTSAQFKAVTNSSTRQKQAALMLNIRSTEAGDLNKGSRDLYFLFADSSNTPDSLDTKKLVMICKDYGAQIQAQGLSAGSVLLQEQLVAGISARTKSSANINPADCVR